MEPRDSPQGNVSEEAASPARGVKRGKDLKLISEPIITKPTKITEIYG